MIMKKIKSSAAVITALAMLFSVTGGKILPAFAADETLRQEEDILSRLSVTPAEANAKVSRYDFAVMIMKAVNKYDDSTAIDESVFSDADGIAVSVLNAAAEYGYFKVPEDGKFRPYDSVTCAEAAAVAVRVLGFEYKIKNGANLMQYTDVARSCGVLKGVNAEDFRGSAVNRLIFNMLTADCADSVYLQNGTEVKTEKRSLLETVFGISRRRGTVTAVSGTAVLGNDSHDMNVTVIGGNEYISSEAYSAEEYLGADVDYYVTEMDGADRLFAMYRRTDGGITVVNGGDITYLAPDFSSLRYYDGGRSKTVYIDPEATIIYNNSKRFAVTYDEIAKENVTVTLTDGNNDDFADTVSVDCPKYYKVASVSGDDMRIDDEDGEESVTLGSFRESLVTVRFEDGSAAETGDIKKDCVLEVFCTEADDGTTDYSAAARFVILRNSVSGKIESIDTSDNTVTINGAVYRYLPEISGMIKTGNTVTAYIGTNGRLVYAEKNADDTKVYGYLVKAAGKNRISSTIEMKIFTQNGEMLVAETGNRVKFTGYINGKYTQDSTVNADELTSLASAGQLIRYSLDGEGKIKSVELAYDHSAETGYVGYDEDRFSLEYHNSRGRLFNVVASENYFYDSKSIIFGIPENGDDEDYTAENYSYYAETDNIDISLYDAGKNCSVAVGVAYVSDSSMPELSYEEEGDTYAALIASKYYTRNSDGDMVTAFKAYCRGSEVRLTANNDKTADNNVAVPTQGEKKKILFDELNPGDVIQYKTNSKGEVNLVNVLNRYDADNPTERQYYNSGSEGYLSTMITAFAAAEACRPGGYFTLENDLSRRYSFADTRAKSYIYLYDVRKQTVEVLDSLPYLNTTQSGNPDYVFVKTRRTSVRDMVIYRR